MPTWARIDVKMTNKNKQFSLDKIKTAISADSLEQEVYQLPGNAPGRTELLKLANNAAYVELDSLVAGYGKMEILHGINLMVAQGQSLCLIGPNGAGKSTVLHSIYGFTNIFSGKVMKNNAEITSLNSSQKLKQAKIAYILQDNSVFPDMTVEENLLMGGFLCTEKKQAQQAMEKILDKYPRLMQRRKQLAGNLSGGERRLLEITRSLIMEPDVLLVDEPSIGLEPRFIDLVFSLLSELQETEKKTIIMVEQNAKKGLEFADIAYVLVSGRLAMAGTGDELLHNPEVGRLFLGAEPG